MITIQDSLIIRYDTHDELIQKLSALIPSNSGLSKEYLMKTIDIFSKNDKELKEELDEVDKKHTQTFDTFRTAFNSKWADFKARLDTLTSDKTARDKYVDQEFGNMAEILNQVEATVKGTTMSIPERMKTHAVYSWNLSEDPSGMTYKTNLKYSENWLRRYMVQHKDANGKVIVLPNGDDSETSYDGFTVSDPNIRWFKETDGTLGYESKNPDIGLLQIWATEDTPK